MPDSEEVDAGASPAVVGSSTGKEPIASPSAVRRFPDGGTEAGPSDRSSSPSALQMGWLEVTTATERLREIDAALYYEQGESVQYTSALLQYRYQSPCSKAFHRLRKPQTLCLHQKVKNSPMLTR